LPDAPAEIIELVDKFERNIEAYKNLSYKEEQLKQEFINPLFKALGWDVDNVSGAAPQYRDVIFEDSIKIAGGTRAPDYCFTLAGRKMFFVEAKKPSVNIDQDIRPSYQLRRYAWSAKLPLSILTDFEEFAVYDSRIRPKKTDRASVSRIKYFTYKDYVEEWDFLYNNFSKDAVLQGSFDKYAESNKKKKGTTEVDQAFLAEIENWRQLFAKNIALRNPELTVEELNFAVQQTIDRIIFLRMCEDRGIEKYGQLQSLITEKDIYEKFGEICKAADAKYNSGLFHFKPEKGRPSTPDELTLSLTIDDGVFKTVFKSLYYPESPYEFSVLQPEILGNVYEQFLGKVIRLTDGHRAKVEEKPEVKKAGGVFYTPQYIVDYIVKSTVGKLCKGKTPNKVSKLRILDPACGSGSFLLGAYKYLLQWHRDYYSSQKDKKRLEDKIYEGKNGEWFLTIQEKKRILLNNIYGVDIDSQAVWVTKLSLLLKVLEGENKDVIEAQQKLYKERALPDLDNNIKCGNSLIGPEIYNNTELELTGNDIKRINPFDWENSFRHIFENGGFDAVIGNPPYIKLHNIEKKSLDYFFKNYRTAEKKCDIYAFFVEKVLNTLLVNNGLLGYIISNTWLNLDSFNNMRQIVSKENKLLSIITLKNPFKKVTVAPIIFFAEKTYSKNYKFKVLHYDVVLHSITNEKEISSKTITPDNYIIDLNATKESLDIVNKIIKNSHPLSDLTKLYYGIMTADNKKFVISESKNENHKPLLSGEDIGRYEIKWSGERYIDYRPDEMKKKKTARPGEPERFEIDEKIVFQRYSSTNLIATIDTHKFYTLGTTIIGHSTSSYSNKYLLGLINSKILSWWYGRTFTSPTNYIREFESIPIHKIKFNDENELIIYNKVIYLVKQMLQLHKDSKSAKTPQDKELIKRQLEATDKQIDALVYELYGLTEDEIRIIENIQ
jgi:hypothetical protein